MAAHLVATYQSNDFPFPLSFSYEKVLNEKNFIEGLGAIFETYEKIVVYVGLLLVALHYQEQQSINLDLDNCRLDHWPNYIDQILSNNTLNHELVNKMVEWHQSLQKENFQSQIVENGRRVNREMGLVEFLAEMRRFVASTYSIMVQEDFQNYYPHCREALDKTLFGLNFFRDYPLYFIENQFSDKKEIVVRELMGNDWKFTQKTLKHNASLLSNNVYIFDKKRQKFYPLQPFIIYHPCFRCIKEERVNTSEIFFLQSRTGQYLSYRGNVHQIGLKKNLGIYRKFLEIVQKNKDEVDIAKLAEHMTQQNLEDLERIHLGTHYFPRKKGEFALQNFLEQRRPLFLMIGEIGVGKTALLVEMAKRWRREGKIVFLWRFFGMSGNGLEQELAFILGENYQQALLEARAKKQQWIVILDGVENVTDPQKIFTETISFVGKNKEVLKVIISMQSFYYCFWEKYFPKSMFADSVGLCPLLESAKPYFRLSSFSLFELKETYYILAAGIDKITPSFSVLPVKIHGLLRNPALARIFLLSLKYSTVPKFLGLAGLLEEFIVNQVYISKHRSLFLDALIDNNIQLYNLHVLAGSLWENGGGTLIDQIIGDDLPNGLSELTREGIAEKNCCRLQGNVDIIVRFPLTVLQHYLIYRSMTLDKKYNDEIVANYLVEIARGNYHLWGVVYFALLELVDKQYFDRLQGIMKKAGKLYPESLRLVMARGLYEILVLKEEISSLGFGESGYVDSLVDNLLAIRMPEVYEAVSQFAVYLYAEERFEAAGALFDGLAIQRAHCEFSYDAFELNLIAGWSYQQGNNEKKAIRCYKKCYKELKKVPEDREMEVYTLLASAHQKLGKSNKAEGYLHKLHADLKKLYGTELEADFYETAGKMAEERGEYKSALEYYIGQRRVLKNLGRLDRMADTMKNIAGLRIQSGNIGEACRLLQEALDLYDRSGEKKKADICRQKLGQLLVESERYSEAFQLLERSVGTLKYFGEKEPLAFAYLSLGNIYHKRKQYDQSLEYFHKTLKYFVHLKRQPEILECFEKLGTIRLEQRELKKAEKYFRDLLHYYQQRHEQKGMSQAYNHMAMLAKARKDWETARHYRHKNLKIYETLEDKEGQRYIHNESALALAHTGNFTQAIEELSLVKELDRALKDRKIKAHTLSSEAFIYYLQGDFRCAQELFLECVKKFQHIDDDGISGMVHQRLGLIYKQQGKFDEAIYYLEQSTIIFEKNGRIRDLTESYNSLGVCFEMQNEQEKALKNYEKEVEFSERLGDKRKMAVSYNNLAIFFYKYNNYARSLNFFKNSLPLYRELNDQEMVTMVSERIDHVKTVLKMEGKIIDSE